MPRPPAQQTLAGVLDWSVSQLDPAARDVFARLSVFHGGCTLDQAERVTNGGDVAEIDVLDALSSLVDVGLVTVDRTTAVYRYVQLEPIRQHAARLLDPAQLAHASSLHGLAFADLSTLIGHGLEGREFARWADTADRELANLRAAHRWAIRTQDLEAAVAIVAGLREYLNERVMTEICDWNDDTVALTQGRGDRLEAVALAAAAVGWLHQTRAQDTIAAFEQVRDHPHADADLVAQAAWAAGWSRINSRDPSAAETIWLAGLDAKPSAWHEAFLRASLTVVTTHDRATAAELVERVGSPTLSAWYRIWTARVVGNPDHLAASEVSLADVVDQTEHIGAAHPLGVAMYCLAFVQTQLPQRQTADVLRLLDHAIALWSRLRIPFQLFATLEIVAFALALRGAPNAAHTLFAAVDARGGAMWRRFRPLVAASLATVPPEEKAASRDRATRFTTLDDAAAYARHVISTIKAGAISPRLP